MCVSIRSPGWTSGRSSSEHCHVMPHLDDQRMPDHNPGHMVDGHGLFVVGLAADRSAFVPV